MSDKWRWPSRIVGCLHLVLVAFTLVMIVVVFLYASVLLASSRRKWSFLETIMMIIYCLITAALGFELYTSFVLITYSTRADADKGKASEKCKYWLVSCVIVMIFSSGSMLIISAQYAFHQLAWIAIANAGIRGAFSGVVFLYVRELRKDVAREHQNAEFNEMDMLYAQRRASERQMSYGG